MFSPRIKVVSEKTTGKFCICTAVDMQLARGFFSSPVRRLIKKLLFYGAGAGELEHGRGKIFWLKRRWENGPARRAADEKFGGIVCEERKPQEQREKQEAHLSFRRPRFTVLRIANSAGISLFIVHRLLAAPIRISSRLWHRPIPPFLLSSPREPGNFWTSQLPSRPIPCSPFETQIAQVDCEVAFLADFEKTAIREKTRVELWNDFYSITRRYVE